MDFALTETQAELKAAARTYLADRYPTWRIAELSDSAGHDLDAWPELARQGWLDPDIGMVELGLLAEESGRALHPAPWWVTVGLALPAYHAAGVALPGPATLADGADTCRAVLAGDDWQVDGGVAGVIDAGAATAIVVAARTGAGVALFCVQPDTRGVVLTDRTGVDLLRTMSDLSLTGASARLLVDSPAAAPLHTFIGQRATALLACEAVGVAGRALELAVEHAKTRVQFDRPIGSYQAIAHQLADCYVEVELARSLAYRAAAVLADPAQDADEPLACAVHAGLRAASCACETAMQVFGGIGVTWEHPLHRWYRRALWLAAWHAGRPDSLATLAGVMLR